MIIWLILISLSLTFLMVIWRWFSVWIPSIVYPVVTLDSLLLANRVNSQLKRLNLLKFALLGFLMSGVWLYDLVTGSCLERAVGGRLLLGKMFLMIKQRSEKTCLSFPNAEESVLGGVGIFLQPLYEQRVMLWIYWE